MLPRSGRRAFLAVALLCLTGARFGVLHGASDPASKSHKAASTESQPIYQPGGDVKAPKLVHSVEPAFSTKSNEAFVEGTVSVSAVVDTRGEISAVQILKGLSDAQNRSALDALKQWSFQPGTKDGKPVNVRVKTEVDFHLL